MLGQAHAQMAVMDVGETAGGGRRGVGVKQSAFDAKMDRWLPVTATKPAAPATTDRAMRWAAHSRTGAPVSPESPRTSSWPRTIR